jgi:hypothetical protein
MNNIICFLEEEEIVRSKRAYLTHNFSANDFGFPYFPAEIHFATADATSG